MNKEELPRSMAFSFLGDPDASGTSSSAEASLTLWRFGATEGEATVGLFGRDTVVELPPFCQGRFRGMLSNLCLGERSTNHQTTRWGLLASIIDDTKDQ
jgi:hypothetical protein